MLPMRDDQQQLKIELLSQWKLEAESRNYQNITQYFSHILKVQCALHKFRLCIS